MKRISFRTDENPIQKARLVAASLRKRLNAAFPKWLKEFAAQTRSARDFDRIMTQLRHVKPSRRFTRDEMNER